MLNLHVSGRTSRRMEVELELMVREQGIQIISPHPTSQIQIASPHLFLTRAEEATRAVVGFRGV